MLMLFLLRCYRCCCYSCVVNDFKRRCSFSTYKICNNWLSAKVSPGTTESLLFIMTLQNKKEIYIKKNKKKGNYWLYHAIQESRCIFDGIKPNLPIVRCDLIPDEI